MNRDQGEAGEGTGEGRTRREDKGEQGRVREARRWAGWVELLRVPEAFDTNGAAEEVWVTGCVRVRMNICWPLGGKGAWHTLASNE